MEFIGYTLVGFVLMSGLLHTLSVVLRYLQPGDDE